MKQPPPGPGKEPALLATPGFPSRPAGATVPEARILIVEDDRVNQKLALHQFRRLGFAVEAAADGRQGIAAWERAPFDLVFMDCHMPEMDGFEATRQIRKLEKERALPATRIIALTANAMDGDRERCLQAGMDDYLSKPVDLEDLKALLRRHLTALQTTRVKPLDD